MSHSPRLNEEPRVPKEGLVARCTRPLGSTERRSTRPRRPAGAACDGPLRADVRLPANPGDSLDGPPGTAPERHEPRLLGQHRRTHHGHARGLERGRRSSGFPARRISVGHRVDLRARRRRPLPVPAVPRAGRQVSPGRQGSDSQRRRRGGRWWPPGADQSNRGCNGKNRPTEAPFH
jgi:hypothetical protein